MGSPWEGLAPGLSSEKAAQKPPDLLLILAQTLAVTAVTGAGQPDTVQSWIFIIMMMLLLLLLLLMLPLLGAAARARLYNSS